jgi:serine/threonine-protein kinase
MTDIDDSTVPAPARRFSLPLAAKFFLGCAFLIALAVGAAVVVTYVKGNAAAAHAVDAALATSSAVQKEFEQNRLEQLQLKVQLFAADASTAKYIAQVGGPSSNLPGLSEGPERDTLSISDLLKERQDQYGFDIGIVMDAQGGVLGRNDQTEAFRESLADDALVRPAIAKAAPFSGYWRQGERLYQAAIMPLQQDQNLVGFVLLAQRVDDALCRQVAKDSGAQVAFWLPTATGLQLVASSLDEGGAKALSDSVAAQATQVPAAIRDGHSLARVPLGFSGQHWIGQLAPTAEGEAALGAVLSLTSTDPIVANYRDLLNWLLIGGALSIAIALLLSYALARGILRPVRSMAEAAELAAAGNYKTRLGLSGKDELARLSQAFDSLLSDLREKSDMEGYVGNLSRFLPDPGADAARPPAAAVLPPPPPARREMVTVLGLEFRQFGRAAGAQTAAQALARFEQVADTVRDCARSCGADAQPLLGPRLALVFDGGNRSTAALQAWSALLERLRASDAELPAAAQVSGEAVLGRLQWADERHPALLGAAMLQLDRLLPEAAPGQMLLARACGDEIKAARGADALTVAPGAV